MKEIWKDIKGYEGHYQVSNFGRVKSLERTINRDGIRNNMNLKEKMLEQSTHSKGYKCVKLYLDKKSKSFKVHQLVAMSFLGHTPNGMIDLIDHKDENKENNKLSNLRIINNRGNVSKSFLLKGNKTSNFTGVSKSIVNNKHILKDGTTKIYQYTSWSSFIQINHHRIYLGRDKDELRAKKLYDLALKNQNLFNGDVVEFRKKIKKML